jgi:hypothetical protein
MRRSPLTEDRIVGGRRDEDLTVRDQPHGEAQTLDFGPTRRSHPDRICYEIAEKTPEKPKSANTQSRGIKSRHLGVVRLRP